MLNLTNLPVEIEGVISEVGWDERQLTLLHLMGSAGASPSALGLPALGIIANSLHGLWEGGWGGETSP